MIHFTCGFGYLQFEMVDERKKNPETFQMVGISSSWGVYKEKAGWEGENYYRVRGICFAAAFAGRGTK